MSSSSTLKWANACFKVEGVLVDRLAVSVFGGRMMKLLGVPKLPNETAQAKATAVLT